MAPRPLRFEDLPHPLTDTTLLIMMVSPGNSLRLTRARIVAEPFHKGPSTFISIQFTTLLTSPDHAPINAQGYVHPTLEFLGLAPSVHSTNRSFADTPDNVRELTLVTNQGADAYYQMIGVDAEAARVASDLRFQEVLAELYEDPSLKPTIH